MKRRTTDGMSLKSEWYNIRNASLDMLILRLLYLQVPMLRMFCDIKLQKLADRLGLGDISLGKSAHK